MIEIGNLLKQARARTDLRDFGDESFMEPLERLVGSINCDSRLTALGEKMVPEMLVAFLVNRLHVEDWYTRHPEINEEQIVAPVFGIGLGRTGSTALGFMLAQDRNTRVLREWESRWPCPPPESATESSDPRIAAAVKASEEFEAMVPEMRDMLPRDPHGPSECAKTLCSAFVPSIFFELWVHIPSYVEWCASSGVDIRPAYEFHKRVIKLLQWRCPPRRWFLRSPVHLFGIEALHATYPDARYVMTHRDPVKSLPSTCSLFHRTRRAFVHDDPVFLGKSLQKQWIKALKDTLAFRDRIGEDRFFDVSHARQVIDPLEQIRPLYAKLGWRFDDDLANRIRKWQDTNPKGKHRFNPGDFGLDLEEIARGFRFYTDRFL